MLFMKSYQEPFTCHHLVDYLHSSSVQTANNNDRKFRTCALQMFDIKKQLKSMSTPQTGLAKMLAVPSLRDR